MATATVEAIRDRVYTLLEALTPTSLSDNKFRRYRNEGGANFQDWAEKEPSAAFRRVQVRQSNSDVNPDVSNMDFEELEATLVIRIAYPTTHRYGAANAMDRDDVINQDWLKINYAIGLYGRANFSSSHDCTPLGCETERETGDKIDYLVVTARYRYKRATT